MGAGTASARDLLNFPRETTRSAARSSSFSKSPSMPTHISEESNSFRSDMSFLQSLPFLPWAQHPKKAPGAQPPDPPRPRAQERGSHKEKSQAREPFVQSRRTFRIQTLPARRSQSPYLHRNLQPHNNQYTTLMKLTDGRTRYTDVLSASPTQHESTGCPCVSLLLQSPSGVAPYCGAGLPATREERHLQKRQRVA